MVGGPLSPPPGERLLLQRWLSEGSLTVPHRSGDREDSAKPPHPSQIQTLKYKESLQQILPQTQISNQLGTLSKYFFYKYLYVIVLIMCPTGIYCSSLEQNKHLLSVDFNVSYVLSLSDTHTPQETWNLTQADSPLSQSSLSVFKSLLYNKPIQSPSSRVKNPSAASTCHLVLPRSDYRFKQAFAAVSPRSRMDYGSGRDQHGSEHPRLAECISVPRHEGGGKEEELGDGEEGWRGASREAENRTGCVVRSGLQGGHSYEC